MAEYLITMKRAVSITFLLLVLLATSLAIHVRMAGRSAQLGHLACVQLGVIELEAPVKAETAMALKRAALSAPGVRHCYVNADAGTIAFGYDKARGTKQSVLQAVRRASPLRAALREPSAAELARSCPVRVPGRLATWLRWIQA